MKWNLYTCNDCGWRFYKLTPPIESLCSWCHRKPRSAPVNAALSLMRGIDARVVPIANPVPSREEWESLKRFLLKA